MKIIILSDYIENYKEIASFKIRYLTALKMSQKGHEVILISPSFKSLNIIEEIINKNFRTITTPGFFPKQFRVGGFSFLDMFVKAKFILTSDFDVIQATNGHRPAQLIPCLLGKYIKKAVIVDECWEWLGRGGHAKIRKGIVGKIVSFYDIFFELSFKGFYDEIITISNTLKNRFKKNENITVLHGGTENGTLKNYKIAEARKELNLDTNTFIVGMSNVCSSDHDDNVIFFEAFGKIIQRYKNCFLLVTGADKKYIYEIGKMYLFSEKLIFPGWVEFEIYNKYLSCCNIFVLPFRNTLINSARWPNKIGDYLCLNRPVITNPTGDVKHLLEQYKVGFLCDQTPEGFYYLIKNILDKATELSSYTKDSLYVAHEVLSFDKRIDKYLEVFEKVRKKPFIG
jgi:glycosyltransferase involved in cell wall biosynthesis